MKKNVQLLQSFWHCLTSVGMDAQMEDKDRKYIRFTNVIAVLTAVAVFGYIPLSVFQGYYTLAVLQSIDVFCVLSVLALNHIGYHRTARHVYILVINSFVLINSCFIGFESRVHDFFYIAYIVPFLLFSVKDHKNILVGVLVSILFFNLFQSIYPAFTRYNLDADTQHIIANINLWMKFVLFGIAIYILSYYNHTTESELAATNAKLKDQTAELRRSNNDLEQFAAIISHDLKAPVRNVSSFMTILMRRYADKIDRDGMNFIELSKNSTDRMAKQIDDLLLYSKVGRNLPPASSVDVNDLIESIRLDLSQKMLDKKAEIIIEHHLPSLRNVHSSMLYHVFQNLISNGIKFNTSDTPQVKISCITTPSEYLFTVSDNGIGIDSMYNDKVFQMFKRLHSETEFEGTGIGLAVCKKIINFYGGSIWLESEQGKGTTFYFSLPRRQSASSQIYTASFSEMRSAATIFAS